MHLTRTPSIVKPLARDFVWDLPNRRGEVFLTFDDGPVPEVTAEVLDILNEFGAKATFFCVGENVQRHPEIYRAILENGHRTGNHTFSHENGWKTPRYTYIRSVAQCAQTVKSDLFRPPYGKISRQQVESLKRRFHLVMWDVLAGDWDASRSAEDCFADLIRHTREGSVIVLHDSLKAKDRVLPLLRPYLSWLKEQHLTCVAISSEHLKTKLHAHS